MKRTFLTLLSLVAGAGIAFAASPRDSVKTTFQSSREWRPTIDNRADAVMVYGVGGNPSDKNRKGYTFEERVKSWRDHGYITHFMTGIAWGEYQDYFTGKWDGKWHLDEGQVTAKGDTIWHGHMVPYIVPSENYLKYMKERHVKRVIDAGINSIFMEEPEFWARAGYSEAFKREWKEYYGFDWRPQHESPENTYLANKLKYYLYYRALNEVFTYAKEYGRSKGMDRDFPRTELFQREGRRKGVRDSLPRIWLDGVHDRTDGSQDVFPDRPDRGQGTRLGGLQKKL